MADLGSDFSIITDMDVNMTASSERLALGEAIARRWITQPGGLFYDLDYGGGLLSALSGSIPDENKLRYILEREALKDERIESADVSVVYTEATQTLIVKATLEDEDGPFDLTLTVSNMKSDGTRTTLPAVELFLEAA